MSTAAGDAVRDAVRAAARGAARPADRLPAGLLTGLIDDAALFPPGNAAMPAALDAHAGHRRAWYAGIVGPFLCPATRVGELRAALPDQPRVDLPADASAEPALGLSLVVDAPGEAAHAALRAIGADPRLTLVLVEAPHTLLRPDGPGGRDDAPAVGANLARLSAGGSGPRGYLEVPRQGWEPSLDVVAAGGWYGAKYRTGGTSAGAFPAEAELAAVLVACAGYASHPGAADGGLPLKLTAGLHHAVRGRDPVTGFEQHGVLNVLAAAALATGAVSPGSVAGPAAEATQPDLDAVAAVLAERDPDRLAAPLLGLGPAQVARVRGLLRSFGCCGVTEPIDELVGLGLLDPAPVEPAGPAELAEPAEASA